MYDFIKYPREPEGRSCRVPSILSICRNRGLAIFESSQPAGLGCSTCFNVLVPHPGSETAFYGHEEQGDSQPQDDGTAIHPDLPGSTLSLAPAERPCPPHAVLCSTTARSTLCQAQCWEHQLPRRWLLAMPKPYWWCPVTGHASLHLRVLQRLLSWSETSFHNSHPADSFNTSQFRHHLLQEVSGDWMRFPLILVSSLSVIPPLSSGASEDETRPDSSWHLLSLAHQHPQYLPLEGNSTKRCPRPALPQRPAHHLSIGRWCQ